MNWMLAVILVCGASVFTSCTSNDDNPATPDLNVAEKIIGKWMTASVDGKNLPTNDKMVYNFISTTEAYISSSFSARPDFEAQWVYLSKADVVIAGNKVTITHHPDEQQTVCQEFTITAINDNEFTANMHVKITANGSSLEADDVVRFAKVKVDYSADIIGMWEGHSTGAEGSEFDDGENHRWEYLLDGTFNYFHKNDLWQISDDEYADYFVAGNLLCTRWKNAGEGNEEHREWWEIESIENGVMKWKALRQREDGSTYTATFEMKKVDVPTQAEVEQNIIGRWMTTQMNFQDIPTNNKIVFEFESLTKAYYNASLNSVPELPALWNKKTELSVAIIDNHIWLTSQKDEHTAFFYELIIAEMSADRMGCISIHTEINDKGETVTSPAFFTTYEKVDKDYSADIVGTWEGQVTSEQDTFGDGLLHRWEYKADGTYVYYVKDGENWVPSTNTLNEYFVSGKLLCSRWINAGKENREWWEIESIENGVMKWKALRQREDGSTYTATFEMKKIELSPSDYKCSRVEVIYRITSPKTNYTFFEGKYAVKSGSDVKIDKLPTFTTGYHEAYNVTDITTFPVEEAICLHYGIKDDLESYAGDYSLNWEMSYTVTSYNAEGYKLDSQTISDQWSENGKVQKKEDLEDAVKLSYSELHASVAENGMITLSKVNKMHPEKSGIEW